MAANTAPPRKDYGPAFIAPEEIAALIFLAQIIVVREVLFQAQILAHHQKHHRGSH